ncbi:MAG: site-specific tyrosine recombinase XerD [Streptococcus minor]|nr:site-specific tyrosine recombinase XerD [Streptococcus minor]
MEKYISAFLAEKELAENSRLAYQYDLQQFVHLCQNQVSTAKLAIYQASIQGCKMSVQKRKQSAVNQFLYFLYEEGYLDRFYKLKSSQSVKHERQPVPQVAEELSLLWQETPYQEGQLIALLVANLGLTPSEIAGLRQEELNLDFQMLSLEKARDRRIISLPKELLPYLQGLPSGTYLFDKKGQPYSRQWFFNRLSEFAASIGHREWTAQYLRDQYILSQLAKGQSIDKLAKQLGLRSPMSLEKYR